MARRRIIARQAAALQIQRAVLSYQQRRGYHKHRPAAVLMQQCARRFLAQLKLQKWHTAACRIQTLYTRYFLGQQDRAMLARQKHAASFITGCCIGYLERNRTAKIQQAAVLIQRIAWGWLARKHRKMQVQAATMLQSWVRRALLRQVHPWVSLEATALYLQRWWRQAPNLNPNPNPDCSHSYCQTRRLLLTLTLTVKHEDFF